VITLNRLYEIHSGLDASLPDPDTTTYSRPALTDQEGSTLARNVEHYIGKGYPHHIALRFGWKDLIGQFPDLAEADQEIERQSRHIVEAFSKTDVEEIERAVRRELKGKENEDRIVKLAKNAIVQFAKALWLRRSFWTELVSGKSE
jgi:hypothetical protein